VNVRKLAEALRLAADALEEEADTPPQTKPRPKRKPALTRPDGEATPIVAAHAARILKDRGFT
jgi:hypothetical protein